MSLSLSVSILGAVLEPTDDQNDSLFVGIGVSARVCVERMGCGSSSAMGHVNELDRSIHTENSHTAKVGGFPFAEYMRDNYNICIGANKGTDVNQHVDDTTVRDRVVETNPTGF